MTDVSESFVDVMYRGLSVARRVKLAQVRPQTGYVEVPQPMPVGTAIEIITEAPDQLAVPAAVGGGREQVGGSEVPPGMLVRPELDGEAAQTWWRTRVTFPDLEPTGSPTEGPPAPAPPIVAVQKRVADSVPHEMADTADTGVMDALDPAILHAAEAAARDSQPRLGDDSKATLAMNAVDLAALGLQPGTDDDGSYPVDGGDGGKPEGKAGTRRRRKRH
jgi:hypothetical protein